MATLPTVVAPECGVITSGRVQLAYHYPETAVARFPFDRVSTTPILSHISGIPFILIFIVIDGPVCPMGCH